jgi:hypothetical protein
MHSRLQRKFIIKSISVLVFFIYGCSDPKYPYNIILKIDNDKDSLGYDISYASRDNMIINRIKYTNNSIDTFNSFSFFRVDDCFFECKNYMTSDKDGSIDTIVVDTVLMFALHDTTFIYNVSEDFISPAGLEKWKYIIKKINNNLFSTTETLCADTTFIRKYYYDRDFQIKRIFFTNGYKTNIYE